MMGAAIKAWLTGSPWVWGLILLALATSHTLAWRDGHIRADQSAEIDRLSLQVGHLTMANKRLQSQIEGDSEALENANARAAQAIERNTELERTADALQAEFAARAALCPIGPDDARRLRFIR